MSIPDRDDLLSAAQDYRARGWRVLALHHVREDGTCSCGRAVCNSAGKHPIEARWQDTPPLSGADVQAIWEEAPHNIGLATGAASGFWVLDVDTDKPGTTERMKALQAGRKLPTTYIVRTGGGGYQYYFLMPDFNVTNSARRLPDGVDVRGTGGQVVAAPSVSGKGAYSVMADAPIVRAPEWLEELVRPLPPAAPVDLETLPKLTDLPESEQRRLQAYTDRIVTAEVKRLNECFEKGWDGPGWNQTTFEVSCTLVELANSPWCPLDLTTAHVLVRGEAPRDKNFDDAEIEGCFSSALKRVGTNGRAMPPNRDAQITVIPGDPLTDPTVRDGSPTAGGTTPSSGEPPLRDWSDLGNARRLVDQYGHALRYIPEAKEWAVYTNGVWEIKSGAGMTAAQEMVENLVEREGHLYSDEPSGEDGDGPSERDKFFKWAKAQQMGARINAAVQQATGRPEFTASLEDFDQEPHLLNVKNGVVDLRTGELRPHSSDDLMMLQTGVRYDPDVATPKFNAFLRRTQPDSEMRDYLQEVVGYSLTGSLAEQAMFLHHGASGSNGKSVFLVIMTLLAGDYAQSVPRETLLVKAGGAEHPTSVARMRGKRFLQASETGIGRRLDEETVKGLTGGEQQSARFMGKDFFEFTPTGKIHLITNHLPRITDADSMWRRLHLIGWRERIDESEQNPEMLEASYWADEAPGILAWAVQGEVRRYARPRLVMPESMRRDLGDYRTDQDILGEFLALRLEKDEAAFAATSDVYGAYQAWAFNNGIKNVMTSPDLAKTLKERGYQSHRTARHRGFRARLIPITHPADTADPLLTR